MTVRKLTRDDIIDASLISVTAFHKNINDYSKFSSAILNSFKGHSWGAFSGDTVIARVVNHRETTHFDGHEVASGCIGGVCTLPEYRGQGAVRAIIEKTLREDYEEGVVVSSLYPFNHAFYRKFRYELAWLMNYYQFSPRALHGYEHNGWAKMWKSGDPIAPFTEVYNEFAKGYNLSFVRDDGTMEKFINGVYYMDKHYCYMLGDSLGASAYVVFDFLWDNKRLMEVKDLAFIGNRGLHALLGFLARFTADYDEIHMPLPSDTDLFRLTENPYDIRQNIRAEYMARITNAQKALDIMRKPANTDFHIHITDELLPDNTGTWHVTSESVVRGNTTPDIVVSEKALTVLTLGFTDLREALYRPDVELMCDIRKLEGVFVNKPGFTLNHF